MISINVSLFHHIVKNFSYYEKVFLYNKKNITHNAHYFFLTIQPIPCVYSFFLLFSHFFKKIKATFRRLYNTFIILFLTFLLILFTVETLQSNFSAMLSSVSSLLLKYRNSFSLGVKLHWSTKKSSSCFKKLGICFLFKVTPYFLLRFVPLLLLFRLTFTRAIIYITIIPYVICWCFSTGIYSNIVIALKHP